MRLLSLADIELKRLDAIFDEEVKVWQRELHWDYRPAMNLIRKFVKNGTLPGVVAEVTGQIVGYSYFVIDHPVAFIGNVYALNEFAKGPAYPKILDELLHLLRDVGQVSRIECQMFPFNRELAPLFHSRGFQALKRFFLTLNLREANISPEPTTPQNEYQICAWENSLLPRASRVIFDGYVDSPDAELCRDYQSTQGCQRFLRNLIQNRTCGTFCPGTSQVAFDGNGMLCGILITSQIDHETGMIPQISIRRSHQNQGLGSLLLKSYLDAARQQGLKRVCLSVSEVNQRAFALYRRLGFNVEKQFHAFIWTRPEEISSVDGTY